MRQRVLHQAWSKARSDRGEECRGGHPLPAFQRTFPATQLLRGMRASLSDCSGLLENMLVELLSSRSLSGLGCSSLQNSIYQD
mmetsp:Transcript_69405/g.125156  ORF Transcript_69405/g.125156 Transcript_69405/m.125156 type:complete len:83 (+) Transcript_69405:398-646(+)